MRIKMTDVEEEEYSYIQSWIGDNAGMPLKDWLPQLVALWTAYCHHQDVEVDTEPYDRRIREMWATIDNKKGWSRARFENAMCRLLV